MKLDTRTLFAGMLSHNQEETFPPGPFMTILCEAFASSSLLATKDSPMELLVLQCVWLVPVVGHRRRERSFGDTQAPQTEDVQAGSRESSSDRDHKTDSLGGLDRYHLRQQVGEGPPALHEQPSQGRQGTLSLATLPSGSRKMEPVLAVSWPDV